MPDNLQDKKNVPSTDQTTGTSVSVDKKPDKKPDKKTALPDQAALIAEAVADKKPDKAQEDPEWKKFFEDSTGLSGKPSATRIQERSERLSGRMEQCRRLMRCFMVWLCHTSKKLEALSWLGFALCFFAAGCKFAGNSWLEMALLIFLGVLFANNGIRLPTSAAGKIVKQAFAKFTNLPNE